jgi:hypothetical protein
VEELNLASQQRLAECARLEEGSAARESQLCALTARVCTLNTRVFDLVTSGAEAAADAEKISLQVTHPLA